ncbi:MAG: AhpC/TSA family protein [Acidobacteriota bacterium]
MFCREQVAQLRGITQDVQDRGAALLAVGNGSPKQAARFQKERKLEFPLLTDPKLAAYRAAGLRRDLGSTLNPKLLGSAFRALAGGHRQSTVQGDPWQQGGAFVFTPEQKVLFSQISRSAGDHVDPKDLLAALP